MTFRFSVSLVRWRGIRRICRFARDDNGATAIEFALVGVPFIALLFAVLETAIVFFAGQVLETAVSDASRLIMTGQAQQNGTSAGQFKNAICDRAGSLFNCASGLAVDVRVINTFSPPPSPTEPDGSGNMAVNTSGFGYNPGQGGELVMVRAVYEWPVVLDFYGFNLSNLGNGRRLLMATSAFRNEPFSAP